MDIIVKNIINIFTLIDGEIYLLMKSNQMIEIDCFDELELVNNNYIKDNIELDNLNLRQCYTFSEKKDNQLVLKVLYIDIINYEEIKNNKIFELKNINNLDKQDIYINKSIEYLKKELILNSTIKKLYPDEFVLPEIQKIYENLLEKKYDRRNFRKKLIKLDVIEDLDKMSSTKIGRPAKLYRFKEIIEDKILF